MDFAGGEEMLDLLLRYLSLSAEMTKFVREVYQLVMREVRNLKFSRNRRKSPQTNASQARQCAENLRRVINIFELADDEREKFIRVYCQWRPKRMLSVEKLREIADSIGKSRKACSTAQIVCGSVGVVGGVAIIGAILFPPAIPALLPAWLGGAAATALIPSFLLPTTTAVTSSLAVGGGIAAGAGGVAQVATSVTEAALLHKRIKEAKEVCKNDARDFKPLLDWFRRTSELDGALAELFDMDILEIISRDLKDFFGSRKVDLSSGLRSALKQCIWKILNHPGFEFRFEPSLHAAVVAVLLVVFLAYRRNRQLFSCVILTQRLGLGLVAGLDAGVEIGRLIASAVGKTGGEAAELIPRAVARKVAVGAFAGLGIALDATNIVLNSIDLVKGSKSEEQQKITEVADKLQDELDHIRQVFLEVFY